MIPLKTAPPGTPNPFSHLSFSTLYQFNHTDIQYRPSILSLLPFSFLSLIYFLILYRYILSIYVLQPLGILFSFPLDTSTRITISPKWVTGEAGAGFTASIQNSWFLMFVHFLIFIQALWHFGFHLLPFSSLSSPGFCIQYP